MSYTEYNPTTRVSSEKLIIQNGQFAKLLAKKTGVSQGALSKAINLISTGLIEALAEGYAVNLKGLGVFETRELKPRVRYHRIDKVRYTSKPSTIVHFRKSETLNRRVRALAAAQVERLHDSPHIPPV
jgi:nucleoid DNA-binding protein